MDRGDGHFIGVVRVFDRICARVGLEDVILRTLRHTFASVAADLGFSELTIAAPLGHAAHGVTQRYIHIDEALQLAADKVTDEITSITDQSLGVGPVAPLAKTALMSLPLKMLVWGLFMDMLPAIFIVVPVLMPLVTKIGIDPVHVGVMVTVNLVIGLITPPYGTALFTGSLVLGIPTERIVRQMVPFFIAALVVLMLITYVPELVLFLPRMLNLL